MMNILITGGGGQLGKCLRAIQHYCSDLNLIFAGRNELDITNLDEVENYINSQDIHYCVNCAAYTDVDKAESDYEKAKEVNSIGPKNLAIACRNNDCELIHVSTDFVFDGIRGVAYSESDTPAPLSVYGLTKLEGELEVQKHLPKHFIIRTSWLYSEHESNFMKTMIKLSKEHTQLNIVSDQIGTPTYAGDLAQLIITIINSDCKDYGLYHYTNEGVASWYDFAMAIFEERNIDIKVFPIKSEKYPTPAKRPHFSVLDKTKIKTKLRIDIPYWKESLKKAISNYHE